MKPQALLNQLISPWMPQWQYYSQVVIKSHSIPQTTALPPRPRIIFCGCPLFPSASAGVAWFEVVVLIDVFAGLDAVGRVGLS